MLPPSPSPVFSRCMLTDVGSVPAFETGNVPTHTASLDLETILQEPNSEVSSTTPIDRRSSTYLLSPDPLYELSPPRW